ncbi:MAG: DUF61 family protein [Candidatus Heimdallarchaeota archaeon]|nr:MAG: DUF61 family protein [Candidatus Heimdallarchaeota archaeon]
MVNFLGFDDKLSNFLKHEIDSINMHLPKKRVTLEQALKGYNYYVSRENNQLYIDKKEIDLLQSLCPQELFTSVQLPILIIRRRDIGQGTYVISGELIEQYLVLKTLEKIEIDWAKFLEEQIASKEIYLYKPDLIQVRKKLPTSTVIGFS